ncbi:MAG: carboxyl-terminal processing protease [Acidobacteriota bacterium]|jgi:carboxyl-terminal processing protease|nr:carboxyl-terminal processing protease [Acidobacteriota bacterium]
MTSKFGIVALAVIISATIAGGVVDVFKRRAPRATRTDKTVASADITEDYQEGVEVIGNEYAGDVDYERATQAAIQGMLSALDPHSLFFPRAEFTKLKEDQDSRLIGIGVTILRHRDGVYVQSAVQNTPAARAGLRYGDRIVEVDGKDARDWTGDQVSKNVRGERGEPVKVKIERAGSPVPITYTIIRESVPLPSIRNAYMIKPGTGYIGLTGGFQHTTADELHEAVTRLKSQGMHQVVLDLRGNPGGLLDQAIEVSSEFLPRGQVIVSVHGRVEYREPYYYRSSGTDPEDFPLVVLINHNTASASEIVAGAIQDLGRGLIIGQTSFGKGLVQRVFQLPFGTGLTLTTAKYFTPYGRSLQRDYSSGSFYDYYVRHDEEVASPSKSQRAPAQAAIDPAIAQPTPVSTPPPPTGPAVTTAAGRVFYGGGGITPDIDIKPLEITPIRGRIAEAAFFFTRELAAGQLPGLDAYRVEKTDYGHVLRPGDFPITDRVVEAFREFVQRDGKLGILPGQIEAEIEFVKLRIRDEIVTAAFATDAGAQVLIDSDPQVLRAVEALPEAKRLAESVRNGHSQG